jgi:hypothetical protein
LIYVIPYVFFLYLFTVDRAIVGNQSEVLGTVDVNTASTDRVIISETLDDLLDFIRLDLTNEEKNTKTTFKKKRNSPHARFY